MKIILCFFLALTIVFTADAQKCKKYLKKVDSAPTSSVFEAEEVPTITKWKKFYEEGSRKMFIKFTTETGKPQLVIQQQTTKNISFKQTINLGVQIKIALIFDNSEVYFIEFENEEENVGLVGSLEISRNYYDLNEKLATLIENSQIKRIEIKSPFGTTNINADKILQANAYKPEKIQFMYQCFLQAISN